MSGLGSVAELVATFGLEVDERGFDTAKVLITELTKGLLGVAAVVTGAVAGLGALVQSTAAAALEASNLSKTAGISAETFQELAYAAESVGFQADDLRDVFLDLSERALDASKGAAEYAEVFQALKVSVKDGNGQLKEGSALFYEVADAMAAMPPGIQRTAMISKLFGETGARLLPVLLKGSAGIKAMAQEARELGLVFDEGTINAADAFGTATQRLTSAVAGLRNALAGPVIEIFAGLADGLRDVVVEATKLVRVKAPEWADRFKKALVFLRKELWIVKAAIATLITFQLLGYLKAMTLLTSAQIAWGSAAVISWLRSAAAAAVATAASWAALLPWVALAAAIAFVADELYTFASGGESFFGDFLKWLDSPALEDNAFIRLFKAGGSLLFDLTDPKKWGKAFDAWKGFWSEAFSWYLGKLKEALLYPVKVLSGIKLTGFSVETRGRTLTPEEERVAAERRRQEIARAPTLGQTSAQVVEDLGRLAREVKVTGLSVETARYDFGQGRYVPVAAPSRGPGLPVTNNFTASVTVSVPPGADPAQVGALTEETLNRWWDSKVEENYFSPLRRP